MAEKWDPRYEKFVSVEEADTKLKAIQQMILAAKPGMKLNSFEPAAPESVVEREDGVVYHNDISYNSQYPNGYLDIWYAPKDSDYPGKERGRRRPTIIYFHGGGFFMGSKSDGDPLAVKMADNLSFIGPIMEHGYNFVNVGYALTPEYRFPTQLVQVNESCLFLMEHSRELGLAMEDVFLKGGSAGADFSEIYAMAVLDPEYARAMGFEAALKRDQIRGLILDEPSLCTADFDNENMNVMFTTWLNEKDLINGEKARLVDVPKHIRDTYFPSYLIASNKDPFFERHTKQLADVLERLDVPYAHYTVDPSKGVYDHGYAMDFASDPISREAYFGMFDFMERCMLD